MPDFRLPLRAFFVHALVYGQLYASRREQRMAVMVFLTLRGGSEQARVGVVMYRRGTLKRAQCCSVGVTGLHARK